MDDQPSPAIAAAMVDALETGPPESPGWDLWNMLHGRIAVGELSVSDDDTAQDLIARAANQAATASFGAGLVLLEAAKDYVRLAFGDDHAEELMAHLRDAVSELKQGHGGTDLS